MATSHSPYAIAPAKPAADNPSKKQRKPPTISRPHVSHTLAVLHEVQEVGAGYAHLPRFGWRVLQRLWHVTPADFDAISLAHLSLQPEFVQQHVLLVLATTAVRNVKNLSAFLSCLVQGTSERIPVCLGFIAGCCSKDAGCPFAHPPIVPAWQLLQERWHVGWLDFDYLVLNSLLLKPEAKQDEVLRRLARMKLKTIRNPSALLSSTIALCERNAEASPRPPTPPTPGPVSSSSSSFFPRPPTPTSPLTPCPLGPGRSRQSSHCSIPESETAVSEGWTSGLSEASYAGSVGPSEFSAVRPLLGSQRSSFSQHSSFSQRSSFSWTEKPESEAELLPLTPLTPLQLSPLDLPVPFPTVWPSPRTSPGPESPGHSASSPTASAAPLPSLLTLAPVSPTVLAPPPAVAPATGPGECLTARVAGLVRERAALAPPAAGWVALQCLWGVGPAHFEAADLERLGERPPLEQEHILLSIAAMDLRPAHDLSAVLRVALATAAWPVCWRYLAGRCPAACPFHHPGLVPAWAALRHHGVSHLAVDYAVLNVLLRLPAPQQECILAELCQQLPHSTEGLSAQLLSVMEQVLRRAP